MTREDIKQSVKNGSKWSISLQQRTFLMNGRKVEWEVSQFHCDIPVFLSEVEHLYNCYKHSQPTEKSETKRKGYFIALKEDKLSDNDFLYGRNRDECRFALEFTVLEAILGGFKWNEELMGKWFWQSKQDKDLVLLRQWFENI